MNITAGKNTYSEDSKSSEKTYSVTGGTSGGFGGSFGTSRDWSKADEVSWVNSVILAENGNVSINTNEDVTVRGGNIYGGTVDITAENLTIESLQNTINNKSGGHGFNVGLTVNTGPLWTKSPDNSGLVGTMESVSNSKVPSGQVGFSERSGYHDAAWVEDQSGIVSNGEMLVNVKDKTELIGAVLGSETGDMTLETGSLEYRDIEDYDYSESYSIKTGQSWGTQPANQSDSTGKTPGSQGTSTDGGGLDKIDPSKGSNTLGGTISGYDKEQLTKATIGEGTIIIKGEEQSEDSEAIDGLNRDLDATQVITRDEETGGLDAEITVSNDWFTRPEEKTKNILDLPENLVGITKGVAIVSNEIAKGAIDKFGKVSEESAVKLTENKVSAGEFLYALAAEDAKNQEKSYNEAKEQSRQALSDELDRDNAKIKKENNEYLKGILGRDPTEKEYQEYYDAGKLKKRNPTLAELDAKSNDPAMRAWFANYINGKVNDFNDPKITPARMDQLDAILQVPSSHIAKQQRITDTAANIIAGNEGYPGIPRYYELQAKIDANKATPAEQQEFWQINADAHKKATEIVDKTTMPDVKYDFDAFAKGDRSKWASVDPSGNILKPNITNISELRTNSGVIFGTAGHEIVGHSRDYNNTVRNQNIQNTFDQTLKKIYEANNAASKTSERSALSAGAAAERSMNIINSSKFYKGAKK
ncbi:hypothetical protein Dip518_000058 [Parelusimicrobium proximum]